MMNLCPERHKNQFCWKWVWQLLWWCHTLFHSHSKSSKSSPCGRSKHFAENCLHRLTYPPVQCIKELPYIKCPISSFPKSKYSQKFLTPEHLWLLMSELFGEKFSDKTKVCLSAENCMRKILKNSYSAFQVLMGAKIIQPIMQSYIDIDFFYSLSSLVPLTSPY